MIKISNGPTTSYTFDCWIRVREIKDHQQALNEHSESDPLFRADKGKDIVEQQEGEADTEKGDIENGEDPIGKEEEVDLRESYPNIWD